MSWITLDNLKRFWKGIRTNPVTFTGEIDLQNTTRYKGKEIATKADVTANSSKITVDDALSSTSTNPVQNRRITAALIGKLSNTDNDNNSITYTGGTITQACDAVNARIGLDARNSTSTKSATLTLTDEGMDFTGSRAGGTTSFSVTKTNVSFNGSSLLTVANANTLYARISNGHLVINGSELWIE